MDTLEAIEKRRSIRRFTSDPFPDFLVKQALEAALLAPNSSNTQTWDFHWIKNERLKVKVVRDCLGQSAARTATQLIVISINAKNWKRSQPSLVEWVKKSEAPKSVILYYEKLIPFTSRWGIFNCLAPFKWIVTFLVGLFRPLPRGPFTRRGAELVAIKSAALAAENFVLAITALGGASCMMEGFDQLRLKKTLGLSLSTQIVMVVGVGFESDKGTWGPRFRLPFDKVVHEYE